MADIFDETVLCSRCGKKMGKVCIDKNGFRMRALECKKCGKYIYHPIDTEEYKKFQELKRRPFNVKLRMVGNSYAISIPREIIELEREMDKAMARQMERMNKIVKLMLEEPGKLSLFFTAPKEKGKEERREE
ncbi:MAG: hypothetical protein K6T16_02795 [Candidatus Pacearchaeota archaeon]|nr:hypothetical protein [Candidatus Pacearchaeota archaeon]